MQRQLLREIEERVLARGVLTEDDVERLRRVLCDDWQISRPEADLLARLRRRVHMRPPAFDELFYQAVKNHVVKDGRISAGEAEWLRETFLADRKVDEEECRFLRRLKDEVRESSPEFEAFFRECLAQPQGTSVQ